MRLARNTGRPVQRRARGLISRGSDSPGGSRACTRRRVPRFVSRGTEVSASRRVRKVSARQRGHATLRRAGGAGGLGRRDRRTPHPGGVEPVVAGMAWLDRWGARWFIPSDGSPITGDDRREYAGCGGRDRAGSGSGCWRSASRPGRQRRSDQRLAAARACTARRTLPGLLRWPGRSCSSASGGPGRDTT
jgi:hypothetical protein